jgi:hypothetical protein
MTTAWSGRGKARHCQQGVHGHVQRAHGRRWHGHRVSLWLWLWQWRLDTHATHTVRQLSLTRKRNNDFTIINNAKTSAAGLPSLVSVQLIQIFFFFFSKQCDGRQVRDHCTVFP